MNRKSSLFTTHPLVLVETLEPRIAPAGLLNESKFTAVTLGTPILLDASGGPGDFQGLTTGSGGGSGSYLLYVTSGKALVYTTDLNGDGKFEPGEITGISLGVDSPGQQVSIILFTDVHGDIATNLLPGHGVSALTDSDNNPNNGRDGRVLLDTDVGSITIRTVTAADLDPTIPGNTVANRLGLTSFSIYGNIYVGGNFGGLTIDTSGDSALATKFSGTTGIERYVSATPQIGSIYTGSAASGQTFHFTQNATNNVEGSFQTFTEAPGEHGGDISGISAASPSTVFSIGTLQTGNGGEGARGGDISNITLNGATGSYELIAGDGGDGATGGDGGSILNFSDLGSITGQVILHTGAGGKGSLYAGGMGGTATFATTKVAAGVELFLGNGGDGFSAGGDGSGLSAIVASSPELTIPIGSKFIGTWHDLGDIGNTYHNADGSYSPEAINFNAPSFFSDPVVGAEVGDNYGDGVFTTSTPGQVEVVFGNGQGGLNDNTGSFNLTGAETVTLHVPGLVDPVVTVGDFNGDGRPDIAVASSSPNNFAGVYVFLNQIGTPLDPINPHNFSKNPLGDHPFSEAMQSAVPSLTDLLDVFNGPGEIVGLTTGDYNGDGIADIGIVENATTLIGTSVRVMGVLFGEAAHTASGATFTYSYANRFDGTTITRNAGSGYFYANSAPAGAASTVQFISEEGSTDTALLHSTAVTTGDAIGTGTTPHSLAEPEVFFYAAQGDQGVIESQVNLLDPATHKPGFIGLTTLSVGAGSVDTNRTPGMVNATMVAIQDFSVADLDNNGTPDLVFLSQTPLQFITIALGDHAGNFSPQSGGGDQSGIYLGTKSNATAMVSYDLDGTGQFNGIALLEFGPQTPLIEEFQLVPMGDSGAANAANAANPALSVLEVPSTAEDKIVQGLDAFYVDVPVPGALHPSSGFGLISPDTSNVLYSDLFILTDAESSLTLGADPATFARFLTANGFYLSGGNGGNSTAGAGGSGGGFGSATLTANTDGTATGPVDITFPMSVYYNGQVYIQAGAGGSGFGGGGNGGAVEGVSVHYAVGTTVKHSNVALAAGNAGNSTAGTGGAGGSIDHVSVESGAFFLAGNGGTGANGGAGGSITGNGITSTYDTTDGSAILSADEAAQVGIISLAEALAIDASTPPGTPAETFFLFGVGLGAGNGGQGSVAGGTGGNIATWNSEFDNVIGGTGGSLFYASGFGGSAAAGVGGNGGSITNSSPNVNQNNLSGDLHLQTGAGGDGLTGGDGGSISVFVNQPTQQSAVPGQLSVIAGNGGIGISSNGGVGGTVSGFSSSATGLPETLNGPGGQLLGIGIVIAGEGGASYGAQGGDGGSVSNIVAQTSSTPIVVAAGAGGEGLTLGGQGGSVVNSTINSAAQVIGKVLIVAGKGGDTSSALASEIFVPGDTNTEDLSHVLQAYGNVTPHAGDGGDISGIIQPTSSQTAVDLIAGNGGSTLNAGTVSDQTTGVGTGGSVEGITLTGTVGAVSRNSLLGVAANPPIQAYAFTDDLGNTTTLSITQIVESLANPATLIESFNDNVSTAFTGYDSISGNVGIVAGEAGFVKSGQPASDGINGSVQNITAESIMSIVAGSVSAVAPVNVLSGITVTDPDGVLGVDRTPLTGTNTTNSAPNGKLDYFTPSGQDVRNLQAGYSIVNADGALFAITIEQTVGTTLRGPRIFPVTATTD